MDMEKQGPRHLRVNGAIIKGAVDVCLVLLYRQLLSKVALATKIC